MSTILTETKGFTPVIDVLAQELGLMTAVVYGIVWRYCQMENKVCSASRETIAEHANISTKTVDRHLDKLCKAGYLKDLHPEWKHRPHIYADTGKLKIEALVRVRGGGTESPTPKKGETESPTAETQGPTGESQSLTGETESPTKIPSYDSSHDSFLGKEKNAVFPEKLKTPAPPGPGGADSGKETDDELDKPDRSGPTARGTRGVGDSDLQNSARTPLSTEQQVRDGIFPPDGGEDSGSGEETPCPLLMSFERRTAAAQREAGAWSDAGEDAVDVAGRALARFCDMQGEAPTDDERRATLRELAETLKPLRATIEEIDGAFDVMTEDFGYRVGNYNVFQDSFKRDLATCIRRARGKKQKKPSDRYARTAELAAESQAARRERMAARSPPVSGDFAWEHAKHELQLQMTKATFDVWVKDTYGLPQEDGVYTVVAPNVKARDWLDDRLKTMAQRTLVGILNEQVEVRFEVQP
jgi:hypothetical protein